MNMIMLLIVASVVFAYYGGASCPKVLKDNKQMLLGVLVGLLLGSFFGVAIEGITDETDKRAEGTEDAAAETAAAGMVMGPLGIFSPDEIAQVGGQ